MMLRMLTAVIVDFFICVTLSKVLEHSTLLERLYALPRNSIHLLW